MTVRYFLVHKQTGKKFQILKQDKEAGTITLKGSHATFTEDFDAAKFKKQGYELKKEEVDA